MHGVKADFEGGDAAAQAFAGFEVEQKRAGIGLQGTELVQLGIKAIGHHPAIPHQAGGLGGNGGGQLGCHPRHLGELRHQGVQQGAAGVCQQRWQRGEQHQAVTQGREVTRAGGAQGEAGGDAFNIRHGAEGAVQGGMQRQQGFDGFESGADGGGVTQGVMQPVTQQTAAHAGAALV